MGGAWGEKRCKHQTKTEKTARERKIALVAQWLAGAAGGGSGCRTHKLAQRRVGCGVVHNGANKGREGKRGKDSGKQKGGRGRGGRAQKPLRLHLAEGRGYIRSRGVPARIERVNGEPRGERGGARAGGWSYLRGHNPPAGAGARRHAGGGQAARGHGCTCGNHNNKYLAQRAQHTCTQHTHRRKRTRPLPPVTLPKQEGVRRLTGAPPSGLARTR